MFASLVKKEAPDFTAKAVMANNTFQEITLSSYRNRYVILFFYPMDFTFVCPTELIAFDKKLIEFHDKGCDVIAVSTDSEYSHLAWKNTALDHGGIGNVQFPIVADITKKISLNYGVLFNEAVALRGLFLIDDKGIIRHSLVNDLSLGRSVDEAMRVLDAVQHIDKYGEVCPANWHNGEEAMKSSIEGVSEYLSHLK